MTTRDDLMSELRKIEARLMASNETKADAWDIGLAIEQLTASASALEAKDAEIARLKLKVLGSTFDENIFEARAIAAESRLAEAMKVIEQINVICHTPTSAGEKACRHFQRDFDAIRKLTVPLINAGKE